MRLRTAAICAALLLAVAAPSTAQSVTLEFADGHVTLVARNVPTRTILAEWARLGGTRFVGADRIAGPPVTLELTGVSERQALEVLLRGVAGYLITARDTTGSGASFVDRVMILPTSTPPRPGSPVATFASPPPPQFVSPDDDPTERPVTPTGRIVIGRPGQTPAGGVSIGGAPEPFPTPATPPPPAPLPGPTPAALPSNPFTTLPGSSRPGEITPVPQQPGNTQPNAPPATPGPDQ